MEVEVEGPDGSPCCWKRSRPAEVRWKSRAWTAGRCRLAALPTKFWPRPRPVPCPRSSPLSVPTELFWAISEIIRRSGRAAIIARRSAPALPPNPPCAWARGRDEFRFRESAPVYYVQTGRPLFTSAEDAVKLAEDRPLSLGRLALEYESGLLGLNRSEVVRRDSPTLRYHVRRGGARPGPGFRRNATAVGQRRRRLPRRSGAAAVDARAAHARRGPGPGRHARERGHGGRLRGSDRRRGRRFAGGDGHHGRRTAPEPGAGRLVAAGRWRRRD